MYSIHDSKAETYTPPFFTQQDGQATRQFKDLVTNPEHPFGKHPQDYTLFFIGTYNDENAEAEKLTPISLGNGVEFLAPQNTPKD